MTVAVTGASGVVGSAIVQKLSDNNIKTRGLTRAEADILDMAGLMKALEGVDAVVHAAGLVSYNPRKKDQLFKVNVEGTQNVVNACLANKIPKLLHISSVAALGRQRDVTIINEGSRWVSGMVTSDYSQSKYLSELEVYRGQEEGLNVSIVNPSFVLSAGDGQRSSSLLFGYVWREGKFYTNFNLNYVDARDVSEIVVRLLKGDFNGERFIASAGSAPLKKVFQLIADRFKKSAPGIHISPGLAKAAARMEEFRAAITGSEPVISRQSVPLMRDRVLFENEKAKKILSIEFQSLESTLDWCCHDFIKKNTPALL